MGDGAGRIRSLLRLPLAGLEFVPQRFRALFRLDQEPVAEEPPQGADEGAARAFGGRGASIRVPHAH